MKDSFFSDIIDRQELKKANILKVREDVLINEYKSDTEITEQDAKEIDEAQMDMCRGKDVYLIVDLRNGHANISKEAENYFMTKGRMVPYIKGVALVQESKPSIFANFLMKLHGSVYSTKNFGSMKEANSWIDKQRQKE